MDNVKDLNNFSRATNKTLTLPQGFTLIELIIVIIILGILSVTVAPKFFTAKGFSEYGYRSDVIAKLRLIQTKAMQQTQSSYCHRVLVTATKLGTPDDDECAVSPNFGEPWVDSVTRVKVNNQDNITFSTSNMTDDYFSFDSMGRPSCAAPCIITINGEQSLSVQIEAEGYIHAL
ncbi:prepilin-type N-terminal cleavage/methylation domain-containing protein [Colwellia sp. C1TZA3]|uniref:prepilin-type N-terminal cleavage/methylation domain-containing protein n=1 Tax=Colwellia sp. C1TZA3 TaxID=2508879 RepID=UPI0011B9F989|nr:prepilin-type N-terminal cleavage/methylation domain-containing protein [Colwellia sp. C1TZA3]TWX72711.1 prepilin-type N-terminal cleavage/methylation domain-containing protein [Colwellia sp. C1TZA3]